MISQSGNQITTLSLVTILWDGKMSEVTLPKIVGKRFEISGFPIRWYMGDGSIVRLVATGDEDDMNDVPDRIYPYE